MHRLPPLNPNWLLEAEDSTRLQQRYPDLWDDPKNKCLTCMFHTKPDRSKTFRWWNADRTEIVDWECDCKAQWVLHRKLLHHGIGKAYQRLSWMDAVDVPDAPREATLDYLDNAAWYAERGMSLIYSSPNTGTGKTLMEMLLAKGLLEDNIDVFMAQMNSIVELFTAGWRSPDEKAYFEQRVMNCGVLCIDDLGKERGENRIDFIDKLIDRVFRHRISEGKAIAATTNFTEEQIGAAYGPYVASLLKESARVVECSGVDWRERSQTRMLEEVRGRLSRPLVLR